MISPGYETKGSQAPTIFDTALNLAGTPVSTTLTQPGPTLAQTRYNLTAALQYRYESTSPPARYTFASTKPGGTTGNGTQINYTGSSVTTNFAYKTKIHIASLNLDNSTPASATPAPMAFEYCTSAKGCSNAPATQQAAETTSIHLTASQPIHLDTAGIARTERVPERHPSRRWFLEGSTPLPWPARPHRATPGSTPTAPG